MTNSFNLQFSKHKVLASHPTLQQLEYQIQPRPTESTASKSLHCVVSFLLLLEGSFSIRLQQSSAAEQNTEQFCPFHLPRWMDCQQFSLCIMNAKVLVQTGVLNRSAVVPGILIIPTTVRIAQHNTQKNPLPLKNPNILLYPTFNNISALHFCLLLLHCWIYMWDLISCISVLQTLSQPSTGKQESQISLAASCFPPLLLPLTFSDLWTICSHSIASFAIRSHKSKHKHCKVLHFQNLSLFWFLWKKIYATSMKESQFLS